jgi:hypothetical protein
MHRRLMFQQRFYNLQHRRHRLKTHPHHHPLLLGSHLKLAAKAKENL